MGMAGIEAALIMPFLLLLYFSLHDLTALITFNRKITSTASTLADAVGQNQGTVSAATIADDMNVVGMIMAPSPVSDVHVDLFDYRMVGTTPKIQWQVAGSTGPACSAPIIPNMSSLMTAGNDVIVAVACMNYTPYVATFLGTNLLGSTSFTIQQTITARPRGSATLDKV